MAVMPHILLDEKMTAPYALLPGDPARLDRIAAHLDQVEELAYNREFRSLRGFYKGVRVMALSTGLGGPSTAVAVEELAKLGVSHMIRIGSCGALQRGIHVGDLVLVNGTVRNDGTSRTYIEDGYPAVADFSLLAACKDAVESIRVPYHIGIARTHDSFYTDEKDEIYAYWKKKGIIASDMETAALYVTGRLRGVKCASILNVVVASEDDLQEQINHYTDGENMASQGEKNEILTALEAFVRINKSTTER